MVRSGVDMQVNGQPHGTCIQTVTQTSPTVNENLKIPLLARVVVVAAEHCTEGHAG